MISMLWVIESGCLLYRIALPRPAKRLMYYWQRCICDVPAARKATWRNADRHTTVEVFHKSVQRRWMQFPLALKKSFIGRSIFVVSPASLHLCGCLKLDEHFCFTNATSRLLQMDGSMGEGCPPVVLRTHLPMGSCLSGPLLTQQLPDLFYCLAGVGLFGEVTTSVCTSSSNVELMTSPGMSSIGALECILVLKVDWLHTRLSFLHRSVAKWQCRAPCRLLGPNRSAAWCMIQGNCYQPIWSLLLCLLRLLTQYHHGDLKCSKT